MRIRFIGRRGDPVPCEVVERFEWAERLTAGNERIVLIIPFNYGGRAEIVDAARTFTGTTEEEFRAHLYAADMHDPEIVIRTGAERRLSNYLLWQCAHSELVFRDELWPDFDRAAFEEVLSPVRGGHAAGETPRSRRRPGEPMKARLEMRAGAALVAMNARYWSTVHPRVRRQLRRWQSRARLIPDPTLRALALSNLEGERFNVEVAATLATLAPRRHRPRAIEAIVALQVMYDYLDGLSEQPAADPLGNSRRLFSAFGDALAPRAARADRLLPLPPPPRGRRLPAGARRDLPGRLLRRSPGRRGGPRGARGGACAAGRDRAAPTRLRASAPSSSRTGRPPRRGART